MNDQSGSPSSKVEAPPPRSTLPVCGDCKYGLSVGLTQPLECHWRPPAVFPMVTPAGQVVQHTCYPQVRRDRPGCGQFAPNLARTQ